MTGYKKHCQRSFRGKSSTRTTNHFGLQLPVFQCYFLLWVNY